MHQLLKVLVFITIGICCASVVESGKRALSKDVEQQLKKIFQDKLHHIPRDTLEDTDANAYVDQVLADMHDDIIEQGLDPYKVEDIDILGVHTQGFLGGFSTIHRVGDAAVSQTDTELYIDVNLVIYNFEGMFNWTLEWLFINYNGDADVLCDYVNLFMSLRGPIASGATEVFMEVGELDTQEIGRITVEVHGFGIFDEIIDMVSQALINLVSDLIPIIMDNIVKVIINEVIADYPFPLPDPPAK